MGCDGGTIPRRDELVKQKKKPEKKDKTAVLAAKWKYCAITQEELKKPVVACDLGKLYSKEAVIQHLLNKDAGQVNEAAAHIKSLKDVTELKLTEPSQGPGASTVASKEAVKGDAYIDTQAAQWVCPVIGMEMNGRFRFSFLRSCGCVLSEKAIKELKGSVCHVCDMAFAPDQVIPLNPTEDSDVQELHARMEARIAKEKQEKKAKKEKKAEKRKINGTDSTSSSALSTPGIVNGKPAATSNSKFRNTDTDSKSKKVESTSTKEKTSIQENPTSSEVFKSLFTTSDQAKKQGRAHWVTYNPFYAR